jgi:hypothetical protein
LRRIVDRLAEDRGEAGVHYGLSKRGQGSEHISTEERYT